MSAHIDASLRLTLKLQEALQHDMFFAQALVGDADALKACQRLVERTNHLRSNRMTADERHFHHQIKLRSRELDRTRRYHQAKAGARRRVLRVKLEKTVKGENPSRTR